MYRILIILWFIAPCIVHGFGLMFFPITVGYAEERSFIYYWLFSVSIPVQVFFAGLSLKQKISMLSVALMFLTLPYVSFFVPEDNFLIWHSNNLDSFEWFFWPPSLVFLTQCVLLLIRKRYSLVFFTFVVSVVVFYVVLSNLHLASEVYGAMIGLVVYLVLCVFLQINLLYKKKNWQRYALSIGVMLLAGVAAYLLVLPFLFLYGFLAGLFTMLIYFHVDAELEKTNIRAPAKNSLKFVVLITIFWGMFFLVLVKR